MGRMVPRVELGLQALREGLASRGIMVKSVSLEPLGPQDHPEHRGPPEISVLRDQEDL